MSGLMPAPLDGPDGRSRFRSVPGETTAVCLCIARHEPAPLMYEWHHVWPEGNGGPSVPENMVWLCPTGHYNVHELIRLMQHAGTELSYAQLQAIEDRPVNRYQAHVAWCGYRALTDRTVYTP